MIREIDKYIILIIDIVNAMIENSWSVSLSVNLDSNIVSTKIYWDAGKKSQKSWIYDFHDQTRSV